VAHFQTQIETEHALLFLADGIGDVEVPQDTGASFVFAASRQNSMKRPSTSMVMRSDNHERRIVRNVVGSGLWHHGDDRTFAPQATQRML
jgi:hypothetical protein